MICKYCGQHMAYLGIDDVDGDYVIEQWECRECQLIEETTYYVPPAVDEPFDDDVGADLEPTK